MCGAPGSARVAAGSPSLWSSRLLAGLGAWATAKLRARPTALLGTVPLKATVTSTAFSPDGRFVVAGDRYGGISVLSVEPLALSDEWSSPRSASIPIMSRTSFGSRAQGSSSPASTRSGSCPSRTSRSSRPSRSRAGTG